MGSSSGKVSKVAVQHRNPDRQLGAQPVAGEVNAKSSNNNNDVTRQPDLPPVPTTLTNAFMENVFLVVAGGADGEDLPAQCVLLKDLSKKIKQPALLTKENVEEAVFERLLIKNPKSLIVKRKSSQSTDSASESGAFLYLYQCFRRWKCLHKDQKFASIDSDVIKCREVIFMNAKTCLQQPQLFANQNVHKQFLDICLENGEHLLDTTKDVHEFLIGTIALLEADKDVMVEALTPILVEIRHNFLKFRLMHREVAMYLLVLKFFTCRQSLAELFMDFNTPTDWTVACSYEQTLVGAVLSISSCPKQNEGPYEFFSNPLSLTSHDIHTTTMFITQKVGDICDEIFQVFFDIVKLSHDLKHKVLHWFGRCLEANRGKPDLWSAHEAEVFNQMFCSDGFCLNLCHVMLLFCYPFSGPNNKMLLKIKPTYCKIVTTTEDDQKSLSVHGRGLPKETPFVPYTEDKYMVPVQDYQFITECFFLTQQALHIGYSIIFKLVKLNNNINRLDKLHSEIKDTYSKKMVELVKQQLSKEVCWYLNLKAAVTEYHLTKLCLNFHIATATWLVQVAMCDNVKSFEPVVLPLPKRVPNTLSYLPEFIMTNITNFLVSMELFKTIQMLKADVEHFQYFMTLILVYMGSPERLTNSDIRAQLAESLEAVLPKLKDDGSWDLTPGGNEELIFRDHPLIGHLGETLLNVFVSIEMTGQSVDSEKKFNYRRSMHKALQYIWRIPVHQQAIKRLSDEALARIDSPDPPLFLRFINLLINDAIFLLDDGLDHMKQIKEQEIERERGEWSKLPPEQYRDKETSLRHLGMMGRHRNIMANHTIYTLEIITREIRGIFCHSVMVDRIAGMLNYFLEHLVGPKQKDYKVKDRKEYEFKPEQIVSDIAHIYLYLGTNDTFCKAVLGETRSFSNSLFKQALAVLVKIGVAEDFLKRFNDLVTKLESLEIEHQKDEEILADAPEEFLDPIMGTLMKEPVILPTSKTTIDKAVIARHLLSDQTDPFTKQALSMDMVIPNTELKNKITQWIKKQEGK